MEAVTMNTPSAGTSSTAESTTHAAFHADRNAFVSSLDPLPIAPNNLTSNTIGVVELQLPALELPLLELFELELPELEFLGVEVS
jgi:hypothetical protein